MDVRRLGLVLALLVVLAGAAPASAGNPFDQGTLTPLALKVGTYYLGDDTAGANYGPVSGPSAGMEYRLSQLNIGSRSAASVYFDYAHGSGAGGNASLYSAGLLERVALGRLSRSGAFTYAGFGIGANLNVLSGQAATQFGGSPASSFAVRQTTFAQKVVFGLQRGDSIFYEAYFRAAPQTAGIITSGVGLSFGYHM